MTLICQQTGLSIVNKDERELVNAAFNIVFYKRQQQEDMWHLPRYGNAEEAKNKLRKLTQLPIVSQLASSFLRRPICVTILIMQARDNSQPAEKMIKSIMSEYKKYMIF